MIESMPVKTTPVEGLDFVEVLQRELSRRCKHNRSYSVRAFSRLLDIESSYLSKLLKRTRPMNHSLIQKFGERLGLTPNLIEHYRSAELKRRVQSPGDYPAKPYYFIPQDAFEIIEDSNHFAILEMMKLVGFSPSDKWIAKNLKISVNEARACLSRLQKVGLLAVQKDGTWCDVSAGVSSHILGPNISTDVHRRSQKKILEEGIRALESIPIEKRDQSSMMMAGSQKQLEVIKEKIKTFRRELGALMESEPEKDAVFQLSISFFPIVEVETNDCLKKKSKKIGEFK